MPIILLLLRLPVLIVHILVGLFTILFFPREPKNFKSSHYRIMMLWMNILSSILGIKVDIRGTPDQSSNLFVSNHVTYLDIIIINKLLPVNFIAKEEISSWPVIGRLASKTGTLFIKRGDNVESSKMIYEMEERFKLQNKIVFFPEGKIGNGKRVRKFHYKLFKSIENKELYIQPIAIRYPRGYPINNNYSEIISDKSLKGEMFSLYLKFLMRRRSHVILIFLDKVSTRDYKNETITNVLADKINHALDNLNS